MRGTQWAQLTVSKHIMGHESNSVKIAQVRRALESLNTRKATGCDNLPARVLKPGAAKLTLQLAFTILARKRWEVNSTC